MLIFCRMQVQTDLCCCGPHFFPRKKIGQKSMYPPSVIVRFFLTLGFLSISVFHQIITFLYLLYSRCLLETRWSLFDSMLSSSIRRLPRVALRTGRRGIATASRNGTLFHQISSSKLNNKFSLVAIVATYCVKVGSEEGMCLVCYITPSSSLLSAQFSCRLALLPSPSLCRTFMPTCLDGRLFRCLEWFRAHEYAESYFEWPYSPPLYAHGMSQLAAITVLSLSPSVSLSPERKQ